LKKGHFTFDAAMDLISTGIFHFSRKFSVSIFFRKHLVSPHQSINETLKTGRRKYDVKDFQ
jgi:hypothetical protein